MKKVISDDLGKPADEIFSQFTPEPVGVASIGQVYACTITDGPEVVVKVQKPGVPELVEEDMYILGGAAVSATKHWEGAQQYDLVGIVQEISDTIKTEMDYIQEGHNAEYFAWFFKDDKTIHVPTIFWESTTARVITMERIHGIGVRDIQALDKAGFDRRDLAKRAVSIWLKWFLKVRRFMPTLIPGTYLLNLTGGWDWLILEWSAWWTMSTMAPGQCTKPFWTGIRTCS